MNGMASISVAEYKRLLKQTKRIQRPEQEFHKEVADILDDLAPLFGFYWKHYPGGGVRSKTEAAIFKGLGVRPGVYDIQITPMGGIGHYIELKAEGRKTSTTQDQFAEEMESRGCPCAVVDTIDGLWRVLRKWKLA